MKKSEELLLAEIKKEFKAPIMEAIEPFSFAMIEARIPDNPKDAEYETFITVYGTHEAGTKGSKGIKVKKTHEGEVICDICGGAERAPLRATIAARIDYIQERVDFMRKELERGFAVNPATFVPDPKRKLSESDINDRKSTVKAFESDIKYFNDLLKEVEEQGKGDQEILCPSCTGINWIDVPEYQDPKKKRKAKIPWKMLMDWLWKALKDAGVDPIQGGTTPGEAGFSSKKDRYGFTIEKPKHGPSKKTKPGEGDINKQVTIATESLGKTNRQVHTRLAKIFASAQKDIPFKIEPWPSPGLEDRVREENPNPQMLNWINQNRGFYVTTNIEQTRPGEDIGLTAFDILPPFNYECKKCLTTTRFPDDRTGDTVQCPQCRARGEEVWNRVLDEPKRAGQVDIQRLVSAMAGADYEEPEEEKRRRLASPMPPIQKRKKDWQNIIQQTKGYSAARRSKRSREAAETFKGTPEYYEKFVKGKEERKELLKSRREWAGPKFEHWDKQIEYLANEADIDNAAMEMLVGKYMDSLGTFPAPFDFDRLDIDDAIRALNIVRIIDPKKDIAEISEEAQRFFDAILEDRAPDSALDDMAKCLVIDLGSDDANVLFQDLKIINYNLDPTCSTVCRETVEFNEIYKEAEGMFDALLLESKPVTKLLHVVPMLNLDPGQPSCWSVILSEANVQNSLAKRNANKIRKAFSEGLRRIAPWALHPLTKLTRAANNEDSIVIAETISYIWDALIDNRPMIYNRHRKASVMANKYGAGELFDARL